MNKCGNNGKLVLDPQGCPWMYSCVCSEQGSSPSSASSSSNESEGRHHMFKIYVFNTLVVKDFYSQSTCTVPVQKMLLTSQNLKKKILYLLFL